MKIVIDIPEEVYGEYVSLNVGRGNKKTFVFHLKDKTEAQTMINTFLSMIKPTQEKMNCDDCIFSDLSHWEEIAPGKAKPVLWCKKHRKFCEDITDCEWFINDRIEEGEDE